VRDHAHADRAHGDLGDHAARWDCARHERGHEITPTWARAGPRFVATAPHVGDPPRTAIMAISAIITRGHATRGHTARWDCARHERGHEITPTWARAGPRYVATARTWGPPRTAISAISEITAGATPLDRTAPGMNVGAKSRHMDELSPGRCLNDAATSHVGPLDRIALCANVLLMTHPRGRARCAISIITYTFYT